VTLLEQDRLVSEEERILFLKQRYLYISASMKDVVRTYKKRTSARWANGYDFSHFPEKVSFQITEASSALAVVELFRILLDEENLSFW